MLQVGDQVRREDDREPAFGDAPIKPQEVPARERIQAGHRLVQHQQLRLLRDRERERDLRSLSAGEPAGPPVERDAELSEPVLRTPRPIGD